MTQYINVPLYSDIHSYKVISATDKKATVIEVKKVPTEKFDGTNQYEMYENAEIVETGKPFEIVKHRGNWGRWALDGFFHPNVLKGTTIEDWTKFPARMVTKPVEGHPELEDVYIIFLTNSGRDKKYFVKMNDHFDNECLYRYDHSF